MKDRILKDHIIICGLGNVGFRTYQLLKAAKQEVVVISDKIHDKLRWQIEGSDKELGDYISKSFDIHQIFSPTDLAAPIFARHILEDSIIAHFNLNNESYLIQTENKNPNNQDTINNTKACLIDNTLIINSNKFIINQDIVFKKNITYTERFFKKFNYLRSPAFEHLRLFLFILFCVIVIAALFLKWAMPLSYSETLYFVTTTVTIGGYGDINFLNSSPVLKIFGCLLMLTGAAAIAVLFSSITEIILTKKLPSVIGGLPVPKKDHVIIIGAGNIGHRIVSSLIENQIPMVIVEDKDKNRYSADINHPVALVDGNLCSLDTLQRANISAKAILIITNDDAENLSISLAVKKLNPHINNIIQIYNEKLGARLQSVLSLNSVLSVARISAPYFAAAALGVKILVAFQWQDQLIFLFQRAENENTSEKNYLKLNNKEHASIKVTSLDLTCL